MSLLLLLRAAPELGTTPTIRNTTGPAAAAPQPFLVRSLDITGSPASMGPQIVPPARPVPGPVAPLLFRSTADPVASTDATPDQLIVLALPVPARPAPVLLTAPRVETVAQQLSTIVNPPAPTPGRPAPTATMLRSAADPASTTDTPTVLLALRVTSTAPLPAPAPTVLVSRDVTPLQPSSNPAAPILGRAPWSTTAPPAVLTRPTADPVATDSPPRPLLAPAGSITYPAPAPVLNLSRDVTALQPSASPTIPAITRALWATTAPTAQMLRSTADAADVPPAPKLLTAPAARLPDLARVQSWRAMPPAAIERRTDGVLLTAPQRPPAAARAWLLTPRAEPTIGPAPKAGGIEPGTRTSAGLAPGARTSPGAAPSLHASPAGSPGTRASASIEPGTRTSPQIEGGA